jgi:DNA-binding NtrC family response regulator
MNILLATSQTFAQDDRQLIRTPSATVRVAHTGADASAMLSRHVFDCVLLCAPFEDCSVETLLEEASRLAPNVPVIIRSRTGSVAEATRCMKAGATQYLGPDTIGCESDLEEFDEILSGLRTAIDERCADEQWRKILVGASPAMQNVAQVIRLVATRRCNVLITGETGTGKEMAARAIHAASSRSNQSMVAVNCSALPENLLEAELFGHTRGAFTGAQGLRIGRFEEANRSTLFLDEIADLPFGVQTKLLRVLQEREVQRLGSSENIKVDFRLVAACNISLPEKIEAKEFREDLFYRLNTVPLRMPPLRERREDIPLLVHHFLKKICAHEGLPTKRVSDETMDRLTVQHWPGNVRQLENAVEMAIALSGDRDVLYPGDFKLVAPAQFRNVCPMPSPHGASHSSGHAISVPDAGFDYEQVVSDFERNIIRQALQMTNGNKKAAADILRLKRTTLNAKLKSLEAVAS